MIGVTAIEEVVESGDEEWDELLPQDKKIAPAAQCEVRRSVWGIPGPNKTARAQILLRGELAEWARGACVRFRIQIGGDGNRMRLIPDDKSGRYEWRDSSGVWKDGEGKVRPVVIALGHVNIWPNDIRGPVEPRVQRASTPPCLILELPIEFVRPSRQPNAAELAKAAASATREPSDKMTARLSDASAALPKRATSPLPPSPSPASAPVAGRVVIPGPMADGVPPPGRSALDQRLAGGAKHKGPPPISAQRRK